MYNRRPVEIRLKHDRATRTPEIRLGLANSQSYSMGEPTNLQFRGICQHMSDVYSLSSNWKDLGALSWNEKHRQWGRFYTFFFFHSLAPIRTGPGAGCVPVMSFYNSVTGFSSCADESELP
jgi:hypothetical protein